MFAVDHGQMNSDEWQAWRRALAKLFKVALVVIVEELLEASVHFIALKTGAFSGDLESSDRRRLQRCIDLFQTAEIIHLIEEMCNVKKSENKNKKK